MFKNAFVSALFLLRRKLTQNKRDNKTMCSHFQYIVKFYSFLTFYINKKRSKLFSIFFLVAEIGFEPMTFGL